MANTVPERQTNETELREAREFSMRNDERSLRILHRISLRTGPFQTEARRAFLFLRRQKPGKSVAMKNLELGLKPEALEEIERAVNEERMLYGEETPERTLFLEMRTDAQNTVRDIRAQGDREHAAAIYELIPDTEKKESLLYQEANEVLQNVVEAMGIKRPIVLEITRNPEMNAFVLAAEKQGGPMEDASAGPLRVYVNAGLFIILERVMRQKGSGFTKDHLAGVLGHELQHLRQSKHNPDIAHSDAKLSQRLEYDADLVSIESADRAGYNPVAMIEVLRAVASLTGGLKEAAGHYFGGTHPMSANRVGDLLDAYNRADRVFYSADAEQRPFEERIFVQAEAWTRKWLRETVAEAKDWSDWNRIAEELERDPNATFADAEMALETFKIQLEARAVLSEAARELRTGELGLRDALVYAANALVSDEKIYFPLWRSLMEDPPYRGNDWLSSGSKVPALGRSALLHLVTKSTNAVHHEDPGLDGSVDRNEIKRLVDSVHADTLLVPKAFADGPFETIEDLYDENNEQTEAFWTKVSLTAGYGAILPADRRQAMALLTARAFWYPRSIGVLYENEDVALKIAVLKDLESMGSKPSGPETSNMSPAQWGQAFGALTNRVATIRAETVRAAVVAPETGDRALELNRGIALAPFDGLSFDETNGALPGATDATRERLRVQDRLFVSARRLFDRDLSLASAEERLGSTIADVPEAKDWMFRRAVVDYVFAKERPAVMPISSAADVEKFGSVRDYFRLVPTSIRRQNGYDLPSDIRDYNQRNAKHADEVTMSMVGELIGADQARKMESFRPEDIGDRLRDIRELANNPLLYRAIHGQVYNPQIKEITKLLGTHEGTSAMKKKLFTRWTQESLRSAGNTLEKDDPKPTASSFEITFQKVRGFFDGEIARETDRKKWEQTRASKRQFSLKATEFYAAAFADDLQELKGLSPTEIDPFQETT